jgi:hypothetical protein
MIASVAVTVVSNAGIKSSNDVFTSRAEGTGVIRDAFVNVVTDDVTTYEANFGARCIARATEHSTVNVDLVICTCSSLILFNVETGSGGFTAVVCVDCAFVDVGASTTTISG